METSLVIDRSIVEHFIESKKSLDFIFTLKRCESCKDVDFELEKRRIEVTKLDITEHRDLARDFDVSKAPTLIRIENGGYKYYTGADTILEKLLKKTDDSLLEPAKD